MIFIVLLLTTRLLPGKVNRNGVLLFLNLLFIAGFYLLINIQQIEIAQKLLWLFVPSTVSLSLFFYRFNSVWMQKKFPIDRYLALLPLIVMGIAVVLELSFVNNRFHNYVRFFRIDFTVFTMTYLFPIYGGMLIALNFAKIRMEEQSNKDAYAEAHLVNLNWSKLSLLFYLLFFVGVIISELINPVVSELLFNISILTLTLYLGYYQIKVIAKYLQSTSKPQSKEFPAAESILDTPETESVAQESQEVDRTKSNEIFYRLDTLIDEEKLYLKSDLTIHELGVKLKMNSKYLSQAINQQGDLNFNKYINQKRIKYAKELLFNPDYSNYSLEGIGNESGFRSKSTFNTTFKSITGVTPSEFRRSGN